MAEALIVRRGGGTSLNFKVLGGTTQPSSPAENTLWVNTSTSISEWYFSKNAPSAPTAGAIWFVTGDASFFEINAVRKNSLMVYPLYVKQYIGGAWVDKEARIYQNGAWDLIYTWNGELYTPGNTWDPVTGGWIGVQKQTSGSYNPYTPTITENTDSFTASMNNNYVGRGYVMTEKDIDLTNWSTLTVEVSGISSVTDDSAGVDLAVFNRANGYDYNVKVAEVSCGINTFAKKTVSLDVRSITGSYAVGLAMFNGGGTRNQSATVYSMKLS